MRVSTGFGHLTCGVFVIFREKEELLCIVRGTELQRGFLASPLRFFLSNLTVHIGPWKEGGSDSP